jgi:hypothetical protein
MSCIFILKKDRNDVIRLLLYRNGRGFPRGEAFCWGVAGTTNIQPYEKSIVDINSHFTVANFEDENEKSVAFSKTSLKDDRYAVLRRAAVRECIKSVGGGYVSGSSVRNKTTIAYFYCFINIL